MPDKQFPADDRRQNRRQDDVLFEQMMQRIYPLIEQQICDNFGCTKAELYELVTTQLRKRRNGKRHVGIATAAFITAMITTAVAVFTDFFRRAQ